MTELKQRILNYIKVNNPSIDYTFSYFQNGELVTEDQISKCLNELFDEGQIAFFLKGHEKRLKAI